MTTEVPGPRRVLAVVPAFNEEAALPGVLQGLRTASSTIDVLVVDDGSWDATADLARAAGVVVASLPFNVGVGGAMRAGFLYALRHGYDTVVQVDADGQHDPGQVPILLAGLSSADVVVGSRFAGDVDYRIGGMRRLAMRVLAWALTAFCGTRLTDVTSGFRAAGPRAMELYARSYPSEYLGDTVESLVLARKARLDIVEVPVTIRRRASGTASQSVPRAIGYVARAALVLLLALVRSPAPTGVGRSVRTRRPGP